MPMLKLKTIIDKMEEIEDSTEFDGWDAWIELNDWVVKQKPPEADGLANWDDAEQSVHPTLGILRFLQAVYKPQPNPHLKQLPNPPSAGNANR